MALPPSSQKYCRVCERYLPETEFNGLLGRCLYNSCKACRLRGRSNPRRRLLSEFDPNIQRSPHHSTIQQHPVRLTAAAAPATAPNRRRRPIPEDPPVGNRRIRRRIEAVNDLPAGYLPQSRICTEPPFELGAMVATCDACDARKWVGEGVNCCKDGDLVMERFPEPPEF